MSGAGRDEDDLPTHLVKPVDFPIDLSEEEKRELKYIAEIAAPIYAKALAPLVVHLLMVEIRKLIRQERVTPVDGTPVYGNDDIDHG